MTNSKVHQRETKNQMIIASLINNNLKTEHSNSGRNTKTANKLQRKHFGSLNSQHPTRDLDQHLYIREFFCVFIFGFTRLIINV